ELDVIATWAAADKQERVLVVEGPAGSGKTRLGTEVRIRRQLAGEPVIWVAAPEAGPFAAARAAGRVLPGAPAAGGSVDYAIEPRDPTATAQALARDILARASSGALFIFDAAEDMDPGSRDVIDRLVRLSVVGLPKVKLLL